MDCVQEINSSELINPLTSADLLSVVVQYLKVDDVLKLSLASKILRSLLIENDGPFNQKCWAQLYKSEFFYEPKCFPDVEVGE